MLVAVRQDSLKSALDGGAAAEALHQALPSHRSHKSANPTEIDRLRDRVHELELATAVRLAGSQMIFLVLTALSAEQHSLTAYLSGW